MRFKIESEFKPTGDQPQAIKQLADGIKKRKIPNAFRCYRFW